LRERRGNTSWNGGESWGNLYWVVPGGPKDQAFRLFSTWQEEGGYRHYSGKQNKIRVTGKATGLIENRQTGGDIPGELSTKKVEGLVSLAR